MRKKYLFIFTFSFIFITLINAQHTVNINKYGLYIVENGILTEIITEKESLAFFFEDYLILHGIMSTGYCIYNIRTKAITKWVVSGEVNKVERANNLIVYFSKEHYQREPSPFFGYIDRSVITFWKRELDFDTLKIKIETQLPDDPFPELDHFYLENIESPYGNDYLQYTITKKVNERLYRYSGRNFYLDINYGPDINLTGKYYYSVHGGKKDIFVVGIHKWDGR